LPEAAQALAAVTAQQVGCRHRRKVTTTVKFGLVDDLAALLGVTVDRHICGEIGNVGGGADV